VSTREVLARKIARAKAVEAEQARDPTNFGFGTRR
jgi:hypothetical protein